MEKHFRTKMARFETGGMWKMEKKSHSAELGEQEERRDHCQTLGPYGELAF